MRHFRLTKCRLWILGRRDGGHATSLYGFHLPTKLISKSGVVSDASVATESRSGYGGERRAFSSTTGTGNGYNGNAHHSGHPFFILICICQTAETGIHHESSCHFPPSLPTLLILAICHSIQLKPKSVISSRTVRLRRSGLWKIRWTENLRGSAMWNSRVWMG